MAVYVHHYNKLLIRSVIIIAISTSATIPTGMAIDQCTFLDSNSEIIILQKEGRQEKELKPAAHTLTKGTMSIVPILY
jgi:hypothetical protein